MAAYLILRMTEEATQEDVRGAIKATWGWIDGQYSYTVIDEEFLNSRHDLASLVFRVEGENAHSELARDLPLLLEKPRVGIRVQVLEAADSLPLEMTEAEVSYFRNESIVESRMVSNPQSGVRLLHIPSGTVARCKESRRKEPNMEGAAALLKALLSGRVTFSQ
jgi:hypothetical protein